MSKWSSDELAQIENADELHIASRRGDVTLRKIRGSNLDTGEAATVRLLQAGRGVIGYPLEFCARFDVGHAVEARDEAEVLFDGEILEEMRFVGDEREPLLGGDRVALDVVPRDRHRPARRRDDPGE